jgi:BlaI family penicillinase repressor
MSIEITKAERAVMEALWSGHPLRNGEIAQRVAADHEWHRKTVSTLVRRLVEKGAVGYEKGIGGFLYSPLIYREDYRLGETKKMVTDLFDGEITPLLACFAKSEVLSRSDLAELRKLIDELDKS